MADDQTTSANQTTPVDMNDLNKLLEMNLISPETHAIAQQVYGQNSPDTVPVEGVSSPDALAAAGNATPDQLAAAQQTPGSAPIAAPDPGGIPVPVGNPDSVYGTNLPGTPPQDPNVIPPDPNAAAQDPNAAPGGPARDPAATTPGAGAGPGQANLVPVQNPGQGPAPFDPYAQEAAAADKSFQAQEAAQAGIAKTQQDAAAASNKVIDDQISQTNALQAQWQQRETDWHNQSQQQLNQMSDYTKKLISQPGINPHQYMDNLSTGGKIAAAIAIALGGLGGGISGQGGNVALDIINRNIDRDIEAQKFNYEQNQNNFRNQQSLYGMLHQQFGDDQSSYLATRSGMLEIAKMQIQKQANNTTSAVAGYNAQSMIGQLGLQQAKFNSEIYMNKYRLLAMQQSASGQGVSPQTLMMGGITPDQQKNAVKLPNGNYGFAPNENTAQETNKAATKYDEINSTLDAMQNLKDQAGRSLPLSEAYAKSDALAAQLAPKLNEYYGINRLSDTDFEHVLKPQIPDATSFRQGKAQAQIDTLRSTLAKDHGIMLQHGVIGYQPVPFTPGARP